MPPLPPGKVSSIEKGIKKIWQMADGKSKETVWGHCQWAAPKAEVLCSHLILHLCLTSGDTLDDTLASQFSPL